MMNRIALHLILAGCVAAIADASAQDTDRSIAGVLWQPSMNVFRRYQADTERMHEFYRDVLGLEQLPTLMPGGVTGGVARFRVGTQEIKLTARISHKDYVQGDMDDATGVRLLTFFFPDEAELAERFEEHGFDRPQFSPQGHGSGSTSALVTDPDGQWVELVVLPGASPQAYEAIEVGLIVSNIDRSRDFYRNFVGLTEVSPQVDARFGMMAYGFRHGSTTVNLYPVALKLPADTGSGGIQYVVSNIERVDTLVSDHDITVDVPLTGSNSGLRTIWLEDPDGITNYFAETVSSRSP